MLHRRIAKLPPISASCTPKCWTAMSRYQSMIILSYCFTLFHTIFLVERKSSEILPRLKNKKENKEDEKRKSVKKKSLQTTLQTTLTMELPW